MGLAASRETLNNQGWRIAAGQASSRHGAEGKHPTTAQDRSLHPGAGTRRRRLEAAAARQELAAHRTANVRLDGVARRAAAPDPGCGAPAAGRDGVLRADG